MQIFNALLAFCAFETLEHNDDDYLISKIIIFYCLPS